LAWCTEFGFWQSYLRSPKYHDCFVPYISFTLCISTVQALREPLSELESLTYIALDRMKSSDTVACTLSLMPNSSYTGNDSDTCWTVSCNLYNIASTAIRIVWPGAPWQPVRECMQFYVNKFSTYSNQGFSDCMKELRVIKNGRRTVVHALYFRLQRWLIWLLHAGPFSWLLLAFRVVVASRGETENVINISKRGMYNGTSFFTIAQVFMESAPCTKQDDALIQARSLHTSLQI
jgi:hypothetical protein